MRDGALDYAQFVINVVLALVACVQFLLLWRSLRLTAASVEAARVSAESAKFSTNLSLEALSTQHEIERAYLTVSITDLVTSVPPEDAKVAFSICVRNVGRTPADVLGGSLTWWIGKTFSPSVEHSPTPVQIGYLPHGGSVTFEASIAGQPLIHSYLYGPQEDGLKLWVFGTVSYRDRFGLLHTLGYAKWLNRVAAKFSGFC